MAEYKLICVADQTPLPMKNNIEWLQFTTNAPVSSMCPGGNYWALETSWFEPLTIAEGGQIATAIVLVWVAGWGVRQVIRVIRR